jgi:hypothetical protein
MTEYKMHHTKGERFKLIVNRGEEGRKLVADSNHM